MYVFKEFLISSRYLEIPFGMTGFPFYGLVRGRARNLLHV
jgi:hypothetical protein